MWVLKCCLAVFIGCTSFILVAQDQIIIDPNGVMRWRKDSSEVTGFGVNYTVPFAHAYRAGKKLNVVLVLCFPLLWMRNLHRFCCSSSIM